MYSTVFVLYNISTRENNDETGHFAMGMIRASRKKLPYSCKRNDQMATSALLSDGPCECEQFYHVELQQQWLAWPSLILACFC